MRDLPQKRVYMEAWQIIFVSTAGAKFSIVGVEEHEANKSVPAAWRARPDNCVLFISRHKLV